MKITVNIDEALPDVEVTVHAPALTPRVEQILATLRILDQQMMVVKGGGSYILDVADIVYVESVDRKTFVYTQEDYYEAKLKLYEVEERLCQSGFLRASKSCLVNLRYIRSIRSELNRKLRLTLENDEQLIVSRQYAEEVKRRLGVL